MLVEGGCEGEVEGFLGGEFGGRPEGEVCEAAGRDFGADASYTYIQYSVLRILYVIRGLKAYADNNSSDSPLSGRGAGRS